MLIWDCQNHHRYSQEADYNEWKSRLHVYGLDLRDLRSVSDFCDVIVRVHGVPDSIINNAAQTVRRPTHYYKHLLPGELLPRDQCDEAVREVVRGDAHSIFTTLGNSSSRSPSGSIGFAPIHSGQHSTTSDVITNSVKVEEVDDNKETCTTTDNTNTSCSNPNKASSLSPRPVEPDVLKSINQTMNEGRDAMAAPRNTMQGPGSPITQTTSLVTEGIDLTTVENKAAAMSQVRVSALDEEDEKLKRYFPVGLVDVTGQQLDLRPVNSWTQKLAEVESGELVETFAINALAPFIINSKLSKYMIEQVKREKELEKQSGDNSTGKKMRFIINVSAMEGKFYRHKSANHPHTNMAKVRHDYNLLKMLIYHRIKPFVSYCLFTSTSIISLPFRPR